MKQRSYLDAMGIDVWQLRDQVNTDVASEDLTYWLIDGFATAGNKRGAVVVPGGADQNAEQQLLMALSRALCAPKAQPEQISQQVLTEQLPKQADIIYAIPYGLTELVHNPTLKAEVWSVLCQQFASGESHVAVK